MNALRFALVALFLLASCRDRVEQPIEYNHKLHVETLEMGCADCHQNVEEGARATIPNIELCADCHADEPATDSPHEKKLLEYVSAEKKIPWKKVYRVDSHIFFSHRRHVVLGKLDCTVCHGNVAEMTKSIVSPAIAITMDGCMECHEKHKVSNDCIWCHR